MLFVFRAFLVVVLVRALRVRCVFVFIVFALSLLCAQRLCAFCVCSLCIQCLCFLCLLVLNPCVAHSVRVAFNDYVCDCVCSLLFLKSTATFCDCVFVFAHLYDSKHSRSCPFDVLFVF